MSAQTGGRTPQGTPTPAASGAPAPAPSESSSNRTYELGREVAVTTTGPGALKRLSVAVALSDVLSDGLSMVYSFFEPSEESRSLGTFMILDHITRARRLGLPYVYLGYWIEGSRKMDYKGRFLPQQRLAPSGWLRVDATGETATEPQD